MFSALAAAVWIIAAVSLAWAGAVLGPESRSGMDGFVLLLFTVVPIRPFSWVMAVVFVGQAIKVGSRAFRGTPSLVISSDGLTLPRGDVAPWPAVRSAALDAQGNLVISLRTRDNARDNERWLERVRLLRRKGEEESVTLSASDLGTDPAGVVKDLARWLAEVRPPGGEV